MNSLLLTSKTLTILFLLCSSLAAQSIENYLKLWDADHGWHVCDVCFSPDGKKVLAIEGTTSENSVKLFNAETGHLIWSKSASAGFGRFSPDMSKIYISGASTLALNASDGNQIWINNNIAECFDLSSNGDRIVIGRELDRSNGKVVMINTADGTTIWEGTTKGPVNSIQFSKDGGKVISGGGDLSDREAILWNSLNGSKFWTYKSGPIIYTVSYSPDGNSIIIGTDWQVVTMLNASSGDVLWTKTLTERFLDSGFTPDSKKVFLSSNNGYVRLFDAANGVLLWDKQISGSGWHKAIRCSPDGTRLATGSEDKHLNIFDVSGGTVMFRGAHTNSVVPVNFSYDGTRIVTGTQYGGKVSVWQKDGTVNVEEYDLSIFNDYQLYQNYPNPFNPITVIKYTIPENFNGETKNVVLAIYNLLGKNIATLVNSRQSGGNHEIVFDGSKLESGVYFYRLDVDSYSQTKKLILIK
jgi:WD40 repeat protein